jgi:hypothetical protein
VFKRAEVKNENDDATGNNWMTNIVFSDTKVWTQSFALAGDVFFHFSHTCSTKGLVFLFVHFVFCGTGIGTQGLHLGALL